MSPSSLRDSGLHIARDPLVSERGLLPGLPEAPVLDVRQALYEYVRRVVYEYICIYVCNIVCMYIYAYCMRIYILHSYSVMYVKIEAGFPRSRSFSKPVLV